MCEALKYHVPRSKQQAHSAAVAHGNDHQEEEGAARDNIANETKRLPHSIVKSFSCDRVDQSYTAGENTCRYRPKAHVIYSTRQSLVRRETGKSEGKGINS